MVTASEERIFFACSGKDKYLRECNSCVLGAVDVPFVHTGHDVCPWGKLFRDLVFGNLREFRWQVVHGFQRRGFHNTRYVCLELRLIDQYYSLGTMWNVVGPSFGIYGLVLVITPEFSMSTVTHIRETLDWKMYRGKWEVMTGLSQGHMENSLFPSCSTEVLTLEKVIFWRLSLKRVRFPVKWVNTFPM